jgi:hypothetical protein
VLEVEYADRDGSARGPQRRELLAEARDVQAPASRFPRLHDTNDFRPQFGLMPPLASTGRARPRIAVDERLGRPTW